MRSVPNPQRVYAVGQASQTEARAFVYNPQTEWMFSHHPYLAYFKGKWIAMWSNAMVGEDDPGQRIAVATSTDFKKWTAPQALATPWKDQQEHPLVLTASGFYEHDEMKQDGNYKGGEYGYPHTFIRDGYTYLIVSRQKEAVEAIRFRLGQL